MHAGIALACVIGGSQDDCRFVFSRRLQAGTSMVAMLIAGGTQWYIIRYLYPHATYPQGTPIIMGWHNLTVQRLIPFVLFMPPFGFTWLALVRHYRDAGAGARVMVSAAAIYLVTWFVVGSIAEERIFLPFAMSMAPWTAICAARRFGEDAVPQDDKVKKGAARLMIQ
jgi:hypothetical protein